MDYMEIFLQSSGLVAVCALTSNQPLQTISNLYLLKLMKINPPSCLVLSLTCSVVVCWNGVDRFDNTYTIASATSEVEQPIVDVQVPVGANQWK
jgi:hypothetical protein